MNQQCAIVGYQANERAARWVAALVLSGSIWYLVHPSPFVPLLLVFDFLCRGVFKGKASPFAFIGRSVLRLLRTPPRMVDAGPKVFAARLGLLFSLVIVATHVGGLSNVSKVVAGVLGACAMLEAFFGFCVGCRVFTLYRQLARGTAKL